MSQYIWGIDSSTTLMAFAFADRDSSLIHTDSFRLTSSGQEGERLCGFYEKIQEEVVQMALAYPPHVVFVEQPAGRFVAPILWFTVGVAQAAVFDIVRCPVWTVTPGKWKKPSIGKGNATKTEIAAWAMARDIDFANQDEADAAGVANAGRMMLAASRWDLP